MKALPPLAALPAAALPAIALLLAACGAAPAGMGPLPEPETVTLRAAIALDNLAAAAPATRALQAFAVPSANPLRPGLDNAAAGQAWGFANVSRVELRLFRVTGAAPEVRDPVGTDVTLAGDWQAGSRDLGFSNLRHHTRYKLVLRAWGDDGYQSYTAARAPEPDADGVSVGTRRVDVNYAAGVAALEATEAAGPGVVYFTTNGADYFTLGTIALPLRKKNFVGDADGGTVTLLPGTVVDPLDAAATITQR